MVLKNMITNIKSIYRFTTIFLLLSLYITGYAGSVDRVNTYQDKNGWKLQVNGKDFLVKGMVWGYAPIGENYSYNLWANSDEQIKKILDYEFELMKAAGVNAIRSFGTIPPRWVTYIYENYGIMTIMNHLMGRYGFTVGGSWIVSVNYSDELTRKTILEDFKEMVLKYKDTPGILMFALGNENNYGLEWSSFEIENFPEGERHKEKAKYLYSLYNETIKGGKSLDTNHPFTIVNGDIQYIDIIKEYCTELDILGVNAYRGISFTDMWKRVNTELGLPVMLTEFGSDAFNAVTFMEEQDGQAEIVRGNWNEIYNKSYGKGEEGNAIGGCQFEWRDEWWKYLQTENLFIHDTNASWENGGYSFDFVHGQNNMNEEWYGICALGNPNEDGVYVAEPRMAYYVLKHIWSIDPYLVSKSEMNDNLNMIDMNLLSIKSNLDLAKKDIKELKAFRLTGGNLQGDMVFNGMSEDFELNGKNGLDFSNGEMLFLDFEFQPTKNISGDFSINILGNVADKKMEQYYGKRGESFTTVTSDLDPAGLVVTTEKQIIANERIEIYDFQAQYRHKMFDLTSFYHVPRYHWGYDGDFFGLLYEATDMEGMDIWNDKAPYGFEFKGKRSLNGLTLVAGPEVYWGANPKAIVKYDFNDSIFDYTIIHSEDFARAEASSTATESTERATRQSAIYLKTDIFSASTLEIGYLFSGSEKIGEEYYYVDDDVVYKNEIELKDTQGIKGKITIKAYGGAILDASVTYAGLVADGGDPLREFDTTVPYSGLGNKFVAEGGILYPIGDFWIMPRYFYRKNLLDATYNIEPSIVGSTLYPGLTPRNRDSDPFAVLDNREAVAGELFFTYDPTPGSYFYAWDNDQQEDAGFAFSIGGNYTSYKTDTDSHLFYYQEGKTNAPFGVGLKASDVWLAKGRFLMNPDPNFKIITNIEAGKQQTTGVPGYDPAEYFSVDAKFIINKKHILSGYAKKDAWGPLDWYRQFNITYPYQFMFDYSMLIDNILDDILSSRIGIKALYRTLDENAPDNEWEGGANDYMFQAGVYYKIDF
ncbi:MAG: hypothetical protein PF638_03405 [Candidatus Delongbacteria bacterium]|jgi:hypothetical protein|nr:hypothetical protein [Candidatus Delongbacteria bacterium]